MELKVEWARGSGVDHPCDVDYMQVKLTNKCLAECHSRLRKIAIAQNDISIYPNVKIEGLYTEVNPADYLPPDLRKKWQNAPYSWEPSWNPEEHDWYAGGYEKAVDYAAEYEALKVAIIKKAKRWMISEEELVFPNCPTGRMVLSGKGIE